MACPLFFKRFGSKRQKAKKYPPPVHDTIVEPFAGGAGYSLEYCERKVVLVEKDTRIYQVWRWLIEDASPEDILALPVLVKGDHVDNFEWKDEGAKHLVRAWLGMHGMNKPSSWVLESNGWWSAKVRQRLADNLHIIKHWKVYHGSYETCHVDGPATWFIDPPYQANVGSKYMDKSIDFDKLSEWCRTREGQVIVCEHPSATWLPFKELYRHIGVSKKVSKEGIWSND
jgi:16S rRNA G966 N2-methylase RsmD